MLQIRTVAAPSRIEGLGVFAVDPIVRGAVVWRPDARFDIAVPEADYAAAAPHLRDLLDRYSYPCPLRAGLRVFEADNGRFMNHADRPNTDFSQEGAGYATRDIAAGEEITCDYRQFHAGFHGF